ncbi:hypothetical protein QFC19_006555 [Naganishia cerealis]|uniref:Uncharacterized protein n=1 Tax=Naganishia cerealis TaxID=610337 RepID=A0ACC2VF79_9TREE|nr:hypothetical protein QFC19_006555 [Naganishia cerealis]
MEKESYYREKTSRMLSKMYDYTNSIAEKHPGQNRGVAATTAAAMLEVGLERLKDGKVPENSTEGVPYTEEELDNLKELASSASEDSKGKRGLGHFVDKLMERLLKNNIAMDTPDSELLLQRVNDPDRKNRPGLSILVIAGNFKALSGRMTGFFTVQYGLIHIITWRHPSKTLTFLVFYTATCLWPHLVLAYPLLFLLFGIMIPGYIHRHPMQTPELIKVRKRGQSLLEFLSSSDETSIVDDIVEDRTLRSAENDLDPVSSRSSDTSSAFTQAPISASALSTSSSDVNEKVKKDEKARYVKSQMKLLMNMRDLQNLTTDLLQGFDAAEVFWYQTAGFKDERLSTFMFYGVILATSIILFLGTFIPWRLIFIQSGWAIVLVCHPRSKKYLKALSENKKRKAAAKPKKVKEEKDEDGPAVYDRNDIIIDDAPEVRICEIFELQVKSLTKNEWSFYCFTSSAFDVKNSTRSAGKKPQGVNHLYKILPPPDWKFDMSYADNWHVDKEPQNFLKERSWDKLNMFVIKEDEDEGWMYDNEDMIENKDEQFDFRRRRLTRECFRYSRPPRQPKHD